MGLTELGEFGLIDRIASLFKADLPKGAIGIGDDCAVIPGHGDECQLVTTDMLVEDVHFLRRDIDPTDLGYKALAVNLSDIAAMGGVPRSALLSLALPPNLSVTWVDALLKGLHGLCDQEKVLLLGGNTTKAPERLVISITMLGSIRKKRIKLRSMARPGDLIAVTGSLGDSAAGLELIMKKGGKRKNDDARKLIERHHRPPIHLRQGQWLAKQDGVHAMMDVSDGIDSDLRRIMEKSNCGSKIFIEKIPLSNELKRVGKKRGWDIPRLALTGGEDYCLLFTLSRDQAARLLSAYKKKFGKNFFIVGEITQGRDSFYLQDQKPFTLGNGGFDHFKPRKSLTKRHSR